MSESHFLISCVQKHWSLFHSGMERKMVEISCLGCAWQAVGSSPKVTAAQGGPMSDDRKRVRRKEKQKKRVRKNEWQKETIAPWPQAPVLPMASPKGVRATCSDNKGSGDQEGERRAVWREAEPGKGREKVFSLSIEMFVFFVSQCLNQ